MQDVSDLMDGELDADTAARQIGRLKTDGAAREKWDTYHLIGDALRGEAQATRGVDSFALTPALTSALTSAFTARLAQALTQEPTVLAPRPVREKSHAQTVWLSAAASIAAIAVVGGITFSVVKQDTPQATVATSTPAAVAVTDGKATALSLQAPAAEPLVAIAGTVVHAPHMHEYLLAHQGISPITAIQGVTPYIRTVSSNNADD